MMRNTNARTVCSRQETFTSNGGHDTWADAYTNFVGFIMSWLVFGDHSWTSTVAG